jgi:hypothetical protein
MLDRFETILTLIITAVFRNGDSAAVECRAMCVRKEGYQIVPRTGRRPRARAVRPVPEATPALNKRSLEEGERIELVAQELVAPLAVGDKLDEPSEVAVEPVLAAKQLAAPKRQARPAKKAKKDQAEVANINAMKPLFFLFFFFFSFFPPFLSLCYLPLPPFPLSTFFLSSRYHRFFFFLYTYLAFSCSCFNQHLKHLPTYL